jgi:hypothetical protein
VTAVLTVWQWDEFLARVRLLAQDHKLPPAMTSAATALLGNAVAGGARSGTSTACSLSLLRSAHAQLHEMQVTDYA